MIFVLDESKNFNFESQASNNINKLALVAGVAISQKNAAKILSFLNLHYRKNGIITKGSQIADDLQVEEFINELLKNGCYGAFSPGDYSHISLAEAHKYKNDWINNLKAFAEMDHPEYALTNKNVLLSKVATLLVEVKKIPPQDFFKMLMIFETLFQLVQKFLYKLCHFDEIGFKGITIIIDTQNKAVQYVIDEGLWYLVSFAYTRKKAFDIDPRYSDKIKEYFHFANGKKSLNIEKLINVNIASDINEEIIFAADYIANFTSKVLRGQIVSKNITDMLSEFYGEKVQFNQFHPTKDDLYVHIPTEKLYAFKKLIQMDNSD